MLSNYVTNSAVVGNAVVEAGDSAFVVLGHATVCCSCCFCCFAPKNACLLLLFDTLF